MTKQVTMFEHERDYIGLDITITDNYGAKTRVVRNAIYSDGKDDLYILCVHLLYNPQNAVHHHPDTDRIYLFLMLTDMLHYQCLYLT